MCPVLLWPYLPEGGGGANQWLQKLFSGSKIKTVRTDLRKGISCPCATKEGPGPGRNALCQVQISRLLSRDFLPSWGLDPWQSQGEAAGSAPPLKGCAAVPGGVGGGETQGGGSPSKCHLRGGPVQGTSCPHCPLGGASQQSERES